MQYFELKKFLDDKVTLYNHASFIPNDPISIPHKYTAKQDIEIAGFFAALFAWGNRTTIINKATELMQLMCHAPYQFITQHRAQDLKPLLQFKHRTFTADDILYCIHFMQQHYSHYSSLESAFFSKEINTVAAALVHFKQYFFSYPHLPRTHKHIASPATKSACKRLNMYLRWMVRKDAFGVDFGIWQSIQPKQLIIPLDVHVAKVARQLGLLHSPKNDWDAAVALTHTLAQFNANDPVVYDYALFSIGVTNQLKYATPPYITTPYYST